MNIEIIGMEEHDALLYLADLMLRYQKSKREEDREAMNNFIMKIQQEEPYWRKLNRIDVMEKAKNYLVDFTL